MSINKKKIIVLGGGFGGLTLMQSLKSSQAELLLLDKQNHHLFQPLLYQVATGALAAPHIAQPLRTIFRNRPEIKTLMTEVEKINLKDKVVVAGNRRFPYDYLVLALGSRSNYFGNDHWAQHASGLKTLADAHQIRNQVLASFERAENGVDNEEEKKRLMSCVIIGAGPTGVEMAGSLAELFKRLFKKDFRNINIQDSRVILIDAVDRPLPVYSESISAKARQQLEKLGVEVLTGTKVEDIRKAEVQLPDKTIAAENIIWTAGVSAHAITEKLDLPKAKGGRLKVESDCSLPGHPEVFAIGDIACLVDPVTGKEAPGIAPTAIQMGKHVAAILKEELEGKSEANTRPAFTYKDKGSLATIGRSRAVAELGKLKFSGFPAWFLWLAIHLILLMGMRNRLLVLLQWFFAYVRNKPGARILWQPHNATQDLEQQSE